MRRGEGRALGYGSIDMIIRIMMAATESLTINLLKEEDQPTLPGQGVGSTAEGPVIMLLLIFQIKLILYF